MDKPMAFRRLTTDCLRGLSGTAFPLKFSIGRTAICSRLRPDCSATVCCVDPVVSVAQAEKTEKFRHTVQTKKNLLKELIDKIINCFFCHIVHGVASAAK